MGSIYYTKRLVKKRPKKGPSAPVKPKAFKSEQSAHDWAKKNNLIGYVVETVGKECKKFKIRVRA